MARQATPDLLAEAVDATPRDDVELVFGAPGASRAALQDVPVGLIDDNPFQPRTDYTGIEELAADIAANGLLQVPKGRRSTGGRVQLQYGHRRLRAVILLGWKTMPVELQTLIDDRDMAVRAWSENHNRQDFTAIDQARYFKKLIEAGWTQKAIAERLGLAAPTISNTLRLLELPDDIQAKVAEKQLSARQGEALVSLMTLPQAILKKGDAHYSADTRPSSIVRAALDGASSDVIRQRTTDLIRLSTTAVHDEPWYDVALMSGTGDIVSSTCKSCPSTIKRESGVFCTGPDTCLKARANLWARNELKLAAAELGIPAHGMKPPYGEYQPMDDYDTRDLFKELRVQGGCPHGNLRLMYEGKSRYRTGPFEGFPEAFPICLHGEGHKCRCLMARQREQAKAGTANKTTESIGKKLVAEAAAVLAEALLTVPGGILRHVWAPMVDYTLENEEAKDLSQDEFVMRMAVQILRRKVDNYNSIQTNKDRIEKILQGAGLVSPWTLAGRLASEPSDDTGFPIL
jgi:ParB/RepB/Spo0J family partition protein